VELHWSDIADLAIELFEAYPEIDPQQVRFTDLHRWVTQLSTFNDDPARGGEKVLEAIQQAWIEEAH